MTTLAAQSLFRRIETQDVNGVRVLLDQGIINLDERDNEGQTPLMIAAQLGGLAIVELLLICPNVDVNAVDNDSWTALMNAAKEGHQSTVECLVEHQANLEHKDTGGWTALMWACYKGRNQVATYLLQRSANPNIKGEHHMTPLIWAAGRGHGEIVKDLLHHGSHVNTGDKYGTTPLIWAARKGYYNIVEILLQSGANIDMAGMNSWTALMIAAKGGHTEVIQVMMEQCPNVNVNAVDKDVFSALTWASKEGHTEIADLLLQKGAYFNMPDRNGDTILIHGVKGGHGNVSKLLLKKYADVDIQGVDGKTSLYWAVEKGHLALTRLLLDFNASTEIANKDGDTPLLKAVRCRNLEMVQILLNKGAKISSTDKHGDTALHISVRGRNKKITELLLRNPKDGRLLYRPNRMGETPYKLDAAHERSILTQVFGARNLNADDSIEGRETDLYSSTIADVLSEPSLHTPITIGLYAKWGSGKSFLIRKLKKEMKTFTAQYGKPLFQFSMLQFFVSLLIALLVSLPLGLGLKRWEIGLGVGLGLMAMQYFFLLLVYLGSVRRSWKWAFQVREYLGQNLQYLSLLLQVIFCNRPDRPSRATASVKFLFTDNARLASVVGEKSIVNMVGTLFGCLEKEYGMLVTRLFRVFRPSKASERGRFRSVCCVPYFLIVLFVMLCVVSAAVMLAVGGIHSMEEEEYKVYNSVLITLCIIVGLALLSNVYTWSRMAMNVAVSPRKRVQRIVNNLDTPKLEGYMQELKKEVELLAKMTEYMDAALNSHTRLVVIVDGLDSCEQERLLQVLDTVHMLFGDENLPFITILAVDPHVVINGIEHNLQGLFRESSINGFDYLRNIVQLPFFLQSQTMPKPRYTLHKQESFGQMGEGCREGSALSIPDLSRSRNKSVKKKETRDSGLGGHSSIANKGSQIDLSKSLSKNAYFSDINPRNMKRLMNILAVTGRLLRACSIEFNWYKLAAWINITEQWPYRLSWMILETEENEGQIDDCLPLKALYDRIVPKLPISKEIDPRLEIDRNTRKLEVFLANQMPLLTVADMFRFLPCTINVDPYLRKLIKEQLQNTENMNYEYSMYAGGPPQTQDNFHALLPGRRPGRHDISPRATPSIMRPMSSLRQGTLSHSASFVSPSNMMLVPYGTVTPQGQSLTPTPSAMSPRVNMTGGLPSEPLSSMSTEDIAQLLESLQGLNKIKLHIYQQGILENNINGMVLLNCELSELKPVMSMTFGDWELFRVLTLALREREMLREQGIDVDLADGSLITPQFTQDLISSDMTHPAASYVGDGPGQRHRRWSGDRASQSRPGGRPPFISKPRQSTSSTTARTQTQDQECGPALTLQVPINMKRHDSFVGEVMFESEALRGVIQASGVSTNPQSDSDSEEEVVIHSLGRVSPIPEEKQSQKSIFSLGGQSMKNTQCTRAEEVDPRYKLDNSDEDSDSEEVALLSMRASREGSSKSLAAHAPPKLKLNEKSIDVSEDQVPQSRSVHVSMSKSRESLKSLKQIPAKKQSVDRSVSMPQGANAINGDTALLLSQQGMDGDNSETTDDRDLTSTAATDSTDLHTSYPELSESLMSTASSSEHLSLRKLAATEDSCGRSAFKVITPCSSRPSSRASSRGDAIRHKSESSEGGGDKDLRWSSRKGSPLSPQKDGENVPEVIVMSNLQRDKDEPHTDSDRASSSAKPKDVYL